MEGVCKFTSEHHVGFESAVWYWHFVECCLAVCSFSYLLVGFSIIKEKS